MKVCLGTNLLNGYLLAQGRTGIPLRIVNGALRDEFDVIIGETTITELARKVSEKRWLRERIDPTHAQALVSALRVLGVVVKDAEQPIPNVSRDFDDDYLVAISIEHTVDYLVNGDKDLLVLAEAVGVRIVSLADFVALLDSNPASD